MVNSAILSGRRVLVVEDEPLVSMLIEDMLKALGCEIVGPAADLDQATSLAETAQIDIAILDINLDGETSGPVADRLAGREVPFVFATGYDTNKLRDVHQDVATLRKPFTEREVAAALAAALHQRQAAAAEGETA